MKSFTRIQAESVIFSGDVKLEVTEQVCLDDDCAPLNFYIFDGQYMPSMSDDAHIVIKCNKTGELYEACHDCDNDLVVQEMPVFDILSMNNKD